MCFQALLGNYGVYDILMVKNQRYKVVVAMSGGVDSSVAAALLVQGGHDVIGVMLNLWTSGGEGNQNRCCAPDAMQDAKKVAGILRIPFYAIDAKEIFKQQVVDYLINGYEIGETPNPCIMCNRFIRWGFLLDRSRMMAADYLATGHYARLTIADDGGLNLLRSCDESKDQSYVLAGLRQEQLSQTLLPLQDMTKKQVREIARDLNLPVANRPDSQDLCFLGSNSLEEFLKRNMHIESISGEIKDSSGHVLGRHNGLAFYTIGQRKKIQISSSQPLYVLKKDLQSNSLIVGPKEELGSNEFTVKDINWINRYPKNETHVKIKIRYKAPMVNAKISPAQNGTINVVCDTKIRDITPGQFAVFYDGETVLGGGFITPN
jgi:tRNA-specific 2-thiouridylase